MSLAHLTINPEDVRASTRDTGPRAAWLEQSAAYLQQAAAEDATVTLTSKQRMLTPEQIAESNAREFGLFLCRRTLELEQSRFALDDHVCGWRTDEAVAGR